MRLLWRLTGVTAVALLLVPPACAGRRASRRLSLADPALGTITSPYGPRGDGFHPGIDIGRLRSLTVRAAAPGRVVHAGYTTGFEGYGDIVMVAVGYGYTTLYAHLSRAEVHVGEQVRRGEQIALAGCSGRCDGTHLHFEVRHDGRPVNPMPFLHWG